MSVLRALTCALLLAGSGRPLPRRYPLTECVILVMLDGVRWQEVFRGPDPVLMSKGGERGDSTAREALMPWVWTYLVPHGQAFGNQDEGSVVRVRNPHGMSYPGYAETFGGFPVAGIQGNQECMNPEPSVMERLAGDHLDPRRVGVFATWPHFRWILRAPTSGFTVQCGPGVLGGDASTVEAALAFVEARHPQMLVMVLDEPDEQAHRGHYDRYLAAIREGDRALQRLWEKAQSLPAMRGRTTLLVSTDHGRGLDPPTWTQHGLVRGSLDTWLLALGPHTPALREVRNGPRLFNAQIASTLATLVGSDLPLREPRMAPPVPAILGDGLRHRVRAAPE